MLRHTPKRCHGPDHITVANTSGDFLDPKLQENHLRQVLQRPSCVHDTGKTVRQKIPAKHLQLKFLKSSKHQPTKNSRLASQSSQALSGYPEKNKPVFWGLQVIDHHWLIFPLEMTINWRYISYTRRVKPSFSSKLALSKNLAESPKMSWFIVDPIEIATNWDGTPHFHTQQNIIIHRLIFHYIYIHTCMYPYQIPYAMKMIIRIPQMGP